MTDHEIKLAIGDLQREAREWNGHAPPGEVDFIDYTTESTTIGDTAAVRGESYEAAASVTPSLVVDPALKVIGNAMAVVAHWNEFGPEHGFEEDIARLEKVLKEYRGINFPNVSPSAPGGGQGKDADDTMMPTPMDCPHCGCAPGTKHDALCPIVTGVYSEELAKRRAPGGGQGGEGRGGE